MGPLDVTKCTPVSLSRERVKSVFPKLCSMVPEDATANLQRHHEMSTAASSHLIQDSDTQEICPKEAAMKKTACPCRVWELLG